MHATIPEVSFVTDFITLHMNSNRVPHMWHTVSEPYILTLDSQALNDVRNLSLYNYIVWLCS